MPQYERRLYEPSDDARTFEGGDDDFQEDEGSRLPLLIVIALVVLASFAGVVWIAYTQGVQRGREDAPRILALDRVPGNGAKAQRNPYAGLDIYKGPKPGDDAQQPQASPLAPPHSASSVPIGTATSPPAPTPRSVDKSVPAPSAAADAQMKSRAATHGARPAPMRPAPMTKPRLNVATTLTQGQAASATPRPIAPKAAPQISSSPSATPAGQQQSAVTTGGYLLQIGSFTSEAEANASWQSYKQTHASVSGYASDVKSADLGKRGVWYRLRIGPFATLAEANAACAKLKAQGSSCLPAKQ